MSYSSVIVEVPRKSRPNPKKMSQCVWPAAGSRRLRVRWDSMSCTMSHTPRPSGEMLSGRPRRYFRTCT